MSQGDGDMGDDMEVTQKTDSGVQAQAQTNESGVQATVRPKKHLKQVPNQNRE